MELDMRKMRILQAIIDDYILTATPVGSKAIAQHPGIGLSSATIRNEMSDLEGLGYLDQPHTSAGRIPSDKAYRLYVNSIMQRARLKDSEVRYIREYFTHTIDEVDEVVRQTASVLSNLTHYTSMVLEPQLHAVRVKHIQLVPVSEGKALCVIVTDAGIARDTIIRIPRTMDAEQLERISRIMTSRFSNAPVREVDVTRIPELYAQLEQHRSFLERTLDAVRRSMDPGASGVALSGARNILSYPEYSDMDKARSFLSAIEEKDLLYKMLTEATKVEFSITIGGENQTPEMRECSVVTATYQVGDGSVGSLGVIGPTRMDYPRVLAMLGFVGRTLSEVLTSLSEQEGE